MMPRHINPRENDKNRTAMAPYNFVPLPNQIYTVAGKPWATHDRFDGDKYSGWIDLTIKTLTPLFIRGPVTRNNDIWDQRDSRLRPETFTTPNGTPMIPGSSIRGMVRTLVEILSFSKIQPVTKEKPFFRSVADDRIGRIYRSRLMPGNKKPQGGYVEKHRDQWRIIPATEVLRVHRDLLNNLKLNVPDRPSPNYYPNWSGQHKSCWFKRDKQKNERIKQISLKNEGAGWEEGTLVLTGSAPKKKYDFVFYGRDKDHPIIIPEEKWQRFQEDDQITQWQENAFPKNKPVKNCRQNNGHLREDEPVFYLCDESEKKAENPDGLLFFGRAQMFRFPYDKSPFDLIPDNIKEDNLDLAEAIFGKVEQKKAEKEQAIKGRVFFEDAVATEGGPELFEDIIVPHILSSPKVTCFPHYLTQDGTKGARDLTTYLEGDQATIRGHKLYWHRWDEEKQLNNVKIDKLKVKEDRQEIEKSHDEVRAELQGPDGKDKYPQHTIIKPIKAGVTFTGRVKFDNLNDIELGALLSAVKLPAECAHKLGMGKPLGLGSVRIEPKLHLIDRKKRYVSWEDDGYSQSDGDNFVMAFERVIAEQVKGNGENIINSQIGLRRIARLDALFHMLTWKGRPPHSETCHMLIEHGDPKRFPADNQGKVNEYRTKPVLPTPHYVADRSEPPWPYDPPCAAEGGTQEPQVKNSGVHLQKTHMARTKTPSNIIQKGQTRTGILKRTGEHWVALFEGDNREALIENLDNIPPDTRDSMNAEFYIIEQSKKVGIKARFEKLL